jgi:hypothetical protein
VSACGGFFRRGPSAILCRFDLRIGSGSESNVEDRSRSSNALPFCVSNFFFSHAAIASQLTL